MQLELPHGWQATPASRAGQLHARRRGDDRALPVLVAAAADAEAGRRHRQGARHARARPRYAQGYQVVEYPHTTRRHVLRAPEVVVKTLDVKVKPNLTVGYVMGVGDEMPPALEQIGARVELLDADDLAWGDLESLRRRDDRRARVRAARRSARQQPAADRLRARRRHGHRQLQQVRVQRRAVRAVSRARSAASA